MSSKILSRKEVEESTPQFGFKQVFTYESIDCAMSDILGQILTAIDAALPSGQQNKATKDLIRNVFIRQRREFREMAESESPKDYPFSTGAYDDVFAPMVDNF